MSEKESRPRRFADDGSRALAMPSVRLSGLVEEPLPQRAPHSRANVRLMVYSHDTFGLGHLQRCLKISRALVETYSNMAVLIVTGSPVVHRYELPAGVDYIKLPAIRKVGPEQYESRAKRFEYERTAALRSGILLETVARFEPHFLLVDHAPAGMKGEMRDALQWLRTRRPDCVNILGLRDVIDSPDIVRTTWKQQNIYKLLSECYDRILIYGAREIFDTAREYDFSPALQSKTQYCNFVSDHLDDDSAVTPTLAWPKPTGAKRVVVSIGGGDGAADVVIGTFMDMLLKFRDRVDFTSMVLPGPFIETHLLSRFKELAANLPVRIESFVNSSSPYFRASDLVIATGGYNTVTQILAHAKRAVIIPRTLYRAEQTLRARMIAERGWVRMMNPDDVTPDALFHEISGLLTDQSQPLARMRAQYPQLLEGTKQISAAFKPLIEKAESWQEGHDVT
jgi:predicted glycosyltransferase